MALIEFNEKAKPEMAKPFGGKLEVGHYYKLRDGHVIKIITTGDYHGVPAHWRLGEFTNGIVGAKWWLENGLFQGLENHLDYKLHVKEETEAPAAIPKPLALVLGKPYVTRGGLNTTPIELFQIYMEAVGGPVFTAHIIKEDGTNSKLKYLWNVNGVYLGSHGHVSWPQGNKNSLRCIDKEV